MKLYTKSVISLLFLLAYGYAYAQQGGQNITVIPPSPAASALEKYIDYPVSIYTGVPDISIPIYAISSGGLKLPISISYHASGIKVLDDNYPLGLGWSLNAGGQISRTLRSKVDEMSISFPVTPLVPPNYPGPGSGQANIISELDNNDMEPDIFSFNLGLEGKKSGRFLFDGAAKNQANGYLTNPMFMPKSNVKFSYNYGSFDGLSYRGINDINLLDEEGVSYTFGDTDNSKEFAFIGATTFTSSWLLTKILPTSRNEADKIGFNYIPGTPVTKKNYFGSMVVLDNCSMHLTYIDNPQLNMPVPNYIPAVSGFYTYISNPDNNYYTLNNWSGNNYNIKELQSITFNGGQANFVFDSNNMLTSITIVDTQNSVLKTARFYYSNFSSYNDKIKLDSVVMQGNDGGAVERYSFEYNPGPAEVSHNPLSQDFWGYFNGEPNQNLVPIWENVPSVSSDIPLEPNPDYTGGFLSDKLRYNAWDEIKTDVPITIGYANRETSDGDIQCFSLKKITYPTGGSTEYELEPNKYMEPVAGLKDVGGLRVKRITARSSSTSTPMNRNYIYGANGNGAGVINNVPGYEDFVTENVIFYNNIINGNGYSGGWARQRTFSSSPNTDLSYLDGSSVYYTHVDVTMTNDANDTLGKTSYSYFVPSQKVYDNYLDNYGTIIQTKFLKVFPGFNLPFLVEQKAFKRAGSGYVPVSATQCDYTFLNPFDTQPSGDPREINLHPMYKFVIKQGDYYPSDAYLSYFRALTSDEGAKINNTTYQLQEQRDVTYSINPSGSLDSLIKVTSYEYASNKHTFPTAITTTSSNSNVYKSKLSYPLDYSGLTGTDDLTRGIKNLQQLNSVSQPIEKVTELWKNSINNGVTAAIFNSYQPNIPFLDKVYLTELNQPSTSFTQSGVVSGSIIKNPAYKERLYVNYSSSGRIKSQNLFAGPQKSYLWSYNGLYPIADVENADYTTVVQVLGGATAVANFESIPFPSDLSVKAFLGPLYTDSRLTDAHVTTYTYAPLIGMTSSTDAKGQTTYYEYDSFQRLMNVRDKDGNILKHTDYHYQNQ